MGAIIACLCKQVSFRSTIRFTIHIDLHVIHHVNMQDVAGTTEMTYHLPFTLYLYWNKTTGKTPHVGCRGHYQ